MDTTFITKKIKIKFFINWLIFTLNLSLTFTSALSLFNSHKDKYINNHGEPIIQDSNNKYMKIAYLYPISIIIGFLIAFAKKKSLLIILCKILFYIFLVIGFAYSSNLQIRSKDDLMASLLLCITDLSLIIADFAKYKIKKHIKQKINIDRI